MAKEPQQQSLSDFYWQNRLLITHIESDSSLQRWHKNIQQHISDIEARKLLILIHRNHKTFILNTMSTSSQPTELTSKTLNNEVSDLLANHSEKVLLVGLDGGLRNRYDTKTFTLEKALTEIDLMPMRQWEVKSNSLK